MSRKIKNKKAKKTSKIKKYPSVIATLKKCEEALTFWNHFNGNGKGDPDSGIPKKLLDIRNDMRVNGVTPQNQHKFKMEIVKQIALDSNPLFVDEMFALLKIECKKLTKRK